MINIYNGLFLTITVSLTRFKTTPLTPRFTVTYCCFIYSQNGGGGGVEIGNRIRIYERNAFNPFFVSDFRSLDFPCSYSSYPSIRVLPGPVLNILVIPNNLVPWLRIFLDEFIFIAGSFIFTLTPSGSDTTTKIGTFWAQPGPQISLLEQKIPALEWG